MLLKKNFQQHFLFIARKMFNPALGNKNDRVPFLSS